MKTKLFYIGMTLLGMLVGFLYYRFYGCTEGCMITGNPWRSTAYFGFMFLLGSNLIKDLITKKS
ncbi:MAG: hypothetical protein K9I25_05625 [Crocinitomicaceae bacterium]|nr:hypothetical protein [Cryomorphaceae bacterium]MCF8269430.1 hypothetical protein [Crocinitomicaceae bacterium]